MPNQGTGRLFRRKDNKYLIYLPKDLCEDSMFPFKTMLKKSPRAAHTLSLPVTISFSLAQNAPIALIVTPLTKPS
jgi:hypothetical protein